MNKDKQTKAFQELLGAISRAHGITQNMKSLTICKDAYNENLASFDAPNKPNHTLVNYLLRERAPKTNREDIDLYGEDMGLSLFKWHFNLLVMGIGNYPMTDPVLIEDEIRKIKKLTKERKEKEDLALLKKKWEKKKKKRVSKEIRRLWGDDRFHHLHGSGIGLW